MVDPTKYPIDHIDLMAFLAREYQAIIANVESLQQEQPEVDLEKELDSLITPELKKHKALPSLMDVACYFYELGLNARKEE